ncbi:hypothetical protein ACQ4LE_008023 [Meloidogyne hapla]|uniref:Uncharacterized protein n=1 Tax=Meloidogyne hapla TaxID=6305 RepID=A0A1I8BZA9_MELHA
MLFIIPFTLLFILLNSFNIGAVPINFNEDFNADFNEDKEGQQPLPPKVGGNGVVPIPLTENERACLEEKILPTFTVRCVPDTHNPAKCSEQDYNSVKNKMQFCSQF